MDLDDDRKLPSTAFESMKQSGGKRGCCNYAPVPLGHLLTNHSDTFIIFWIVLYNLIYFELGYRAELFRSQFNHRMLKIEIWILK